MNASQMLTKQALLEAIQTGYTELMELYKAVPEAEMLPPITPEGWSIKDILAHIAHWEKLTTARLHAAFTGAPLGFTMPASAAEFDAHNAQAFAASQALPLTEVQAGLEAAHQELIRRIQSLPDDFLHSKLNTTWAPNRPVQVLIAANTFWHYNEHMATIENYLEKKN